MPTAVRYQADPGFLAGIARDAGVRAVLREAAEAALPRVVAAVPAGRGRERRKYGVEDTATGAQLVAYSSFWHLVEYGSVHNRPYRPLRRGIEAIGARLLDGSGGAR